MIPKTQKVQHIINLDYSLDELLPTLIFSILAAYDQALNLDVKDPSVPLNYAVFLFNRNESDEARKLLQMFEMRVQRLRQTPPGLDADPDVRIININVQLVFSFLPQNENRF